MKGFTGGKLLLFVLVVMIISGVILSVAYFALDRPSGDAFELTNNNPNIQVSVNSQDKLNRFLADKISSGQLNVIIETGPFDNGVDEYREDGAQKTYLGGYAINSSSVEPVVQLAIDSNNTRKFEWSEENVAQYLELRLIMGVLAKHNLSLSPDDIRSEARKYSQELTAQFPDNLFSVSYVN